MGEPAVTWSGVHTTPSQGAVHRIHDRYLHEVIEGLNLCPFARRSREEGRVHRPLFFPRASGDPTPERCAEALAQLVATHDDAEIVLLTFVPHVGHPFCDVDPFEAFVPRVRDAYGELGASPFYMVAFHPGLGTSLVGKPLTRHNLVPLIRRTPDPVIQCVRAEVLDRVRREAQDAAMQKLEAEAANAPQALRAMLKNAVLPDSELSASIARANFDAVGSPQGQGELTHRLVSILRERAAAYDADPNGA